MTFNISDYEKKAIKKQKISGVEFGKLADEFLQVKTNIKNPSLSPTSKIPDAQDATRSASSKTIYKEEKIEITKGFIYDMKEFINTILELSNKWQRLKHIQPQFNNIDIDLLVYTSQKQLDALLAAQANFAAGDLSDRQYSDLILSTIADLSSGKYDPVDNADIMKNYSIGIIYSKNEASMNKESKVKLKEYIVDLYMNRGKRITIEALAKALGLSHESVKSSESKPKSSEKLTSESREAKKEVEENISKYGKSRKTVTESMRAKYGDSMPKMLALTKFMLQMNIAVQKIEVLRRAFTKIRLSIDKELDKFMTKNSISESNLEWAIEIELVWFMNQETLDQLNKHHISYTKGIMTEKVFAEHAAIALVFASLDKTTDVPTIMGRYPFGIIFTKNLAKMDKETSDRYRYIILRHYIDHDQISNQLESVLLASLQGMPVADGVFAGVSQEDLNQMIVKLMNNRGEILKSLNDRPTASKADDITLDELKQVTDRLSGLPISSISNNTRS